MADPITVTVILSSVTEKIFEALLSKGTGKFADAVFEKFGKDAPVKRAFQQALGEAIKRYATSGTRFMIAEPLLQEDGFLKDQAVAEELAQVLRFDRPPNYQLIGDRWKSALEEPPHWRDFTHEAETLTNYLREELKASEVFGPALERHTLEKINYQIIVSTEALYNIADELTELRSMMEAPMRFLMRAVSRADLSIQEQVRDFTWYIEDKTRNFVGRQFVFEQFEAFMQKNPRGYFLVRGDPGIGKTAIAAQWIKTHNAMHHFNIRSLSINRAETFLSNICAQLIAAYELDYPALPQNATQDSGFLMQLLNEAAKKRKADEKVVIVVDALDEAEELSTPSGPNLLCLPLTLPEGVYVFATSRRIDLRLRIECEQQRLDIHQDQAENMADITLFIDGKAQQAGIQKYIADQEIDQELFVGHLADKSQGNFMYLSYVLHDIAHGIYQDLSLDKLPAGLMNYYEDHWLRMRQQSENAWLEYKLPIVIVLSIVKEPVSVDLIADFSQVQDGSRIRAVLREWQQFLYERKVEYEGSLQKRYRIYHDSFREFIASKDEVEGEHVDIKKAHRIIANTLWDEFFDKEEKTAE